MPKFWRLEGKVNGADLGDGKFHFSFQSKEDIEDVLVNAPYHYDSWMVSVVRWAPVVAEDYPTDITFWAKIRGIPMQYWAEGTFKAVGRALGREEDIDVEAGYVRVTINGFQPLVVTTVVPFDDGNEVTAKISYEKLANHCKFCYRLSHLASSCPELSAETVAGKGDVEEAQLGITGKNEKDEQGGWEPARKRSVKRALRMTDFAPKEMEGKVREDTRYGIAQGGGRDGRVHRREGTRNNPWDGQARSVRFGDQGFKVKETRSHVHGKRRGAAWPVPLYPSQSEGNGQASKSIGGGPREQGMSKAQGKQKEVMEADWTGLEGLLNGESSLEFEDSDLIAEEGEFLLAELAAEENRRLSEETGLEDINMEQPTGTNTTLNEKVAGIEGLTHELVGRSLEAKKVIRKGNMSPRLFKGMNSRKRNLMLLASPRKSNGTLNNGVTQVMRGQERRNKEVGAVQTKPGRVQRSIPTKKKGTVALPKLPANT